MLGKTAIALLAVASVGWLRQRWRWLAAVVAAEATAVAEVAWAEAMAAASAVVAWHSMMVGSAAVVVDSANFVVVDFMIAISGAAASDSDSVTTMTTTLIIIRMDMGMGTTRIGMDTATRTPPAMGTTKTTAVAM